MHNIGPVKFAPPDGFANDEITFSFVTSAKEGEEKKKQSMIVRQRRVNPEQPLAAIAGQDFAELLQSVKGIKDVTHAEIVFDDGAPGHVMLYSFPARGTDVVRQYHAVRKDGDRLTALTLTALLSELDESTGDRFLATIASLVAADGGATKSPVEKSAKAAPAATKGKAK
jgi:hypothetical protein